MRHLNYNHLLYFWTVAREGSIARASEVLHLTPQTISGQLKLLDEACGHPLFNKAGRGLVLSEIGHVVFGYADDIFSIGAELASVVRGNQLQGRAVLSVGMVSTIPKLIAERVLAPAISGDEPVRLRTIEAPLEQLLADLAVHRLDLVLSDQPIPPGMNLTAFNHELGTSGLSFFARGHQAASFRRNFPHSLNDRPMVLPEGHSPMRNLIDEWLEANGITPQIVGEFSDSALLKAFGEAGFGVFAGPTAIEQEICRMYRSKVVGQTDDIQERFFAISPERRIRHPAVVAITDTARRDLFAT